MKKQENSRACFICGVDNGAGLRVAFYETVGDDGSPEVVARFVGGSHHQGYPGRMHGGIVAGVLDETVGRAVNAGAAPGAPAVWGVAAELQVRYVKPVPLDVELTARGRLRLNRSRLFEGSGEIYLPDGSIAATAVGKYVKLPLDEIADVDPEALGWRVYEDEP